MVGDGCHVTDPTNAVFLSYASQDAEAAQKLCNALRAAGIEVWFDQSELRGGEAWDQTIRQRIRDCRLFVPIISAHSEARLEGYFRREWKLAADRMDDMASKVAFLVPVVTDDTPTASAEVPERFRQVQWSRLPKGDATPAFVGRICALLGLKTPIENDEKQSAPTHIPISSRRRERPAVWCTIGLTAILVVIAGGWIYWHQQVLKPPQSATSSESVSDKSIAVLPFTDLSEKHDQEYLADGISEEIIYLLAKIPDLRVIGRTSSFQFKGRSEDLRTIGATLGAAYLVEGSVRRFGNRVRISAQLIDARDGSPRWSETYDRESSDALTLQDEITGSLTRALQLEMSDSAGSKTPGSHLSAEAHEAYLRGLHAFNRFDEAGFEEAAANFKQVLEIDPTFVPAAEQLARTYCDQPSWGFVLPAVGYERARTAASAVLQLDPQSPVGHAVLACVHVWYDWDWVAARRETDIAMKAAPRDAFTLVIAAEEREAVGEWREAARLCEGAKAADPLTATIFQNVGQLYLREGRYPQAEDSARRVLQISSTYVGGHVDLGRALVAAGKGNEALIEMQSETLEALRLGGLALVFEALHRKPDAQAALNRLVASHAADSAFAIAEAYAYGGHPDQALEWLDRAYAQKDIQLWGIKGDPFLAALRGDQRYRTFLQKMNVPE
jgi:TolB-like protein